MDTIVPRKNRKNKYILIGSTVFLILLILIVMSMTKKRSLDVSINEISVKTVMVENFDSHG